MKYLTLLCFVILLFSCREATVKQEENSKYFEGFVEFEVSYAGQNQAMINNLKKGTGAKTINYVSASGFFSREYIDSNNIITSREIYRPDSLKFYVVSSGSDTIISSNVTIPDNSFYKGVIKNKSYRILNHQVYAVSAKTVYPGIQGSVSSFVMVTYYNDVNYSINPLIYKGALFGAVEEMFTHAPYLTTGYRMAYSGNATITGIAKRIVPSHVGLLHFEIPKNKVIIEQ